jgi:hypothetical protein
MSLDRIVGQFHFSSLMVSGSSFRSSFSTGK